MKTRTYNFNFDWKFCDHDCDGKNFDRFAGDKYKDPRWVKAGNNGLAVTNFDDSTWESVNLPHDFVIERCEFTPEESDSVGALRKGKVWYRKTFRLPEESNGKRVFVRFDGAFRDSQVWCNGHFIGRHLGGYLGFTYELTEVLKRGQANTIAVFVDATGYEGWWYEGGGLYRDAFLLVTPPVCVAEHSVFIKPYDIDLITNTCKVALELGIDSNQFVTKTCSYALTLHAPDGTCVATVNDTFEASPLAITTVTAQTTLQNIQLWDIEHPQQYTAHITLTCDGTTDEITQTFGVRRFDYNAVDGLKLNGKTITLNGACGHDDLAGVGTALTTANMEYKIKTLQAMGCNSYRCSHNPPSPAFLDACDRMGFLVLDEHRMPGISAECLDDFKTLIKRDRNHPSVVFYSMANEEMGIQDNQIGIDIFSKMIALGEQLDDSRDFFFAVNCNVDEIVMYLSANGYKRHIHGVNYLKPKVGALQHQAMHDHNPDCCFVSTETSGMCSIRGYSNGQIGRPAVSESGQNCGVWYNPKHDGMVTCYGDCGPFWGLTPEEALKEHNGRPYFLGQYLWTGFDYRGEVFPFAYPQVISTFGVIDLCGFFKDWAYYLKAHWGNEPVLHIFPSWNLPFAEGETVSVWAFSNCDAVELFLNGESQGKQALETLGHLEWNVPYHKGELKAVGYQNGVATLTETLVTSGEAYQLVLTAEKTALTADHADCTVVTVEVADKDGNLVPDATIAVDFALTGNGRIKGVGNGDPQSHEHDKAPKRNLFAGKAMVIVESDFVASELTLTASAEGVRPASVTLNSIALPDLNSYVFGTQSTAIGAMRERYIDL